MDGFDDDCFMKSIISFISAHHTFNILFLHLFIDFFCLFPSAAGGECGGEEGKRGRGGGNRIKIRIIKYKAL